MNRRSLLALIGLAPVASIAAAAPPAAISKARIYGYATGVAGCAAPLSPADAITVEVTCDLSRLEDYLTQIRAARRLFEGGAGI